MLIFITYNRLNDPPKQPRGPPTRLVSQPTFSRSLYAQSDLTLRQAQ